MKTPYLSFSRVSLSDNKNYHGPPFSSMTSLKPFTVVNNYVIYNKLTEGHFGQVYICKSTESQRLYAAKVETANKHVDMEYTIYHAMSDCPGFPKVWILSFRSNRDHFFNFQVRLLWKGTKYSVLILQLLGASLGDIHKIFHRRFSLGTVTQIAIQMLDRLEAFHRKGFVCIIPFDPIMLLYHTLLISSDPSRY